MIPDLAKIGFLIASMMILITTSPAQAADPACMAFPGSITVIISKQIKPDDPLYAAAGETANAGGALNLMCGTMSAEQHIQFIPNHTTEKALRPAAYPWGSSNHRLFSTSLAGITLQIEGSSYTIDPDKGGAANIISKVLDNQDQRFQRLVPSTTIAPMVRFGAKVAVIVNDLNNVEGGPLGNMEIGNFTADTGAATEGKVPLMVTGNITVVGCAANIPATPVNMGSVSSGSFENASGPPTGYGSNPSITINVRCFTDHKIQMRVEGVHGNYSAKQGLINLTPNSTAKGVAIQLLYNKKPIALGTNMLVKNKDINNNKINDTKVVLEARYYRTGDISVGTANATANIIFTYS